MPARSSMPPTERSDRETSSVVSCAVGHWGKRSSELARSTCKVETKSDRERGQDRVQLFNGASGGTLDLGFLKNVRRAEVDLSISMKKLVDVFGTSSWVAVWRTVLSISGSTGPAWYPCFLDRGQEAVSESCGW